MYNGQTGEQFKVATFINPIYYQRLKHMVKDKIHSRDLGPVQLLTRQPAEGRSRQGGLRLGEMERDCIICHGAPALLYEKTTHQSDGFEIPISVERGDSAVVNPRSGIYRYGGTHIYENEEIVKAQVPYAFNLLRNEMKAMCVDTIFEMED